jgi:hypothetical protein
MQFIDLRKQVVRSSEGLGGFDSGLSINFDNTTTNPSYHPPKLAFLCGVGLRRKVCQPISDISSLTPQVNNVLEVGQAFLLALFPSVSKFPSALQFLPLPFAIFTFFAAHADEFKDQFDPGNDVRHQALDPLNLSVTPSLPESVCPNIYREDQFASPLGDILRPRRAVPKRRTVPVVSPP